MKIKLSVILILLYCTTLIAQTSTITGSIIFTKDDRLLTNTKIRLISSNNDTVVKTINYDGIYTFDNVKKGTYKLVYRGFPINDKKDSTITVTDSIHIVNLKADLYPSFYVVGTSKKEESFEFSYAKCPDNATMYKYIIKNDTIYLKQSTEFRTKHSDVFHVLNKKEKSTIKHLVQSYNLLKPSTYEKNIFGPYNWNIKFKIYGNKTFTLNLLSYHNEGLEKLVNYATKLIPKRKKLPVVQWLEGY